MKQIVIAIVVAAVFCGCKCFAQDTAGLSGPAYAAAMKERLRKLQDKNASAREAKAPAPARRAEPARATPRPVLTGPQYAAARQQMVWNLQRRNARAGFHGQGLSGPYYAAANARAKANQRLWNGTWQNNTYFWYTPYRKPGSVSRLNDPWLWYNQQPYGWFQRRY